MVDYSRFDNIDTESSEDEPDETDASPKAPPLAIVFEGHRGEEATTRLKRQKEMRRVHIASVDSIAFVDSNTVVSGGPDCKARIWDARTGVERLFDVRGKKLGHSSYCFNSVVSVSVARTRGIVATASLDGCLRTFDFTTGKFAGCHDAAGADTTCAFSPDEKLIACGSFAGHIRILKAGHVVWSEKYQLAEEWPDSDREEDAESEPWSDPAVLAESMHHEARNGAPAFSGRSLAWLDATTVISSGHDNKVCMMNFCNDRNKDGKKVLARRCQVLAPNDSLSETEFVDIAVSPVEPLFAVCRSGGAQLFYRPRRTNGYLGRNEDNPSPFLPAPNDLDAVISPAFTPDGLLLAMIACSDARATQVPTVVSLHSVKSHQVEKVIDLGSAFHKNLPCCLAISPNGRKLAIGRMNGIAFSLPIETPKSTLTTFLLYRAASSSRATVSDDAPRACHLLAQLVDRGLVAAAAHAVDFLGC
jgi:WD40 repeat protein